MFITLYTDARPFVETRQTMASHLAQRPCASLDFRCCSGVVPVPVRHGLAHHRSVRGTAPGKMVNSIVMPVVQ